MAPRQPTSSIRTASAPFGIDRRALLRGAISGVSATLLASQAWAADPSWTPPALGVAGAPAITLRFATAAAGLAPMSRPLHEIIQTYQTDFPNVTISVEETPGNDHQTKIKLDASSNRLPDIFTYWRLDPGFGLDQIAKANLLADLTSWTKADPFFQGLFDEYSWRTASLDGHVYGIPINMFYIAFLGNKDVFRRAGVALPTDWPSLLASVKALKAKGELPWAISIGNDSQGGRIYNYVVNRMVGNDRALRMHSGREPIAVPEMLDAATLLRELVVGYVPEDAIAIRNEAVYAKYVNANKGGLIMDGSWAPPTIKPAVQQNLVVLDFPLIPGGAQTERNVERDLTTLIYMSAKAMADSTRRPYILELIRRMSSRAAGKMYAEEAQQPIPMLGVTIDPAKIDRLTAQSEALALAAPANKWIPAVMKPTQRPKFEPLLGEFLAGKYEPQRFVDQLGVIFKA